MRSENADDTLSAAFGELAELEYRLGDWPAAHASARQALRAARSRGLDSGIMSSLVRLASIEAGLGRSSACRRHAAEAVSLSRRHGARDVEATAAEAVGFLELGLGRVDAAVDSLEWAAAIRAEHSGAAATCMGDLAEAYQRRGDRAAAEGALARLPLHAVERSRAMLADDATFDELFRRALAWNARAQQPFEQARTQLCFGERLEQAGRPREAREQLSAALDTFEALGAGPWAARTRRSLAAARRRPGARRPRTVRHERGPRSPLAVLQPQSG